MKRDNENVKQWFWQHRIFFICLLLALTGGIFIFGSVNAVRAADLADEEHYIEGDYEYTVQGSAEGRKYAQITKYLGNDRNVIVPDTLGGYPVYEVMLFTMEQEDLERFARIESVAFPETMINLDGMACMWFENLTSVTIPEGTECIGTASFFGCSALKELTIPASVTYITGDISNNNGIEYHVQAGSYADRYLTEAGKKVVRTGTKIPVEGLLIEGQKEYTKTVEIKSPEDSRKVCIEASLTPSDASDRGIKWTVDNLEVIRFREEAGLNNFGRRMYFDVKKGGQATAAAVAADGGYTARCLITAKMNIACQEIVLSEETYEYDGNEKRPEVTVENLTEGEDYLVEYSDNIEVGTGTVTIRGLGLNTGSVSKSFQITPKKAETETGNEKEPPAVTAPDREGGLQDAADNVQTEVKVKKPSALKVKNIKKKKVRITWKKVKGADGYELYRGTKKNGRYAKIKTIKKAGTVKYTDSRLKKKKQYYYKIRAYKIVNGNKYYSSFTGKKGIKIRK